MPRTGSTNPKRSAERLSAVPGQARKKAASAPVRQEPATWETVDLDEPGAAAKFFHELEQQADQRIRAAVAGQKARGIIDASGKRVKSELPKQMRSGSYFPV
jgi:hypothetical protein